MLHPYALILLPHYLLLSAQDIETYLANLGQALQQLRVQCPVRILIVGGAFILTQMHNRPAVNDVDVVLKDVVVHWESADTRGKHKNQEAP